MATGFDQHTYMKELVYGLFYERSCWVHMATLFILQTSITASSSGKDSTDVRPII